MKRSAWPRSANRQLDESRPGRLLCRSEQCLRCPYLVDRLALCRRPWLLSFTPPALSLLERATALPPRLAGLYRLPGRFSLPAAFPGAGPRPPATKCAWSIPTPRKKPNSGWSPQPQAASKRLKFIPICSSAFRHNRSNSRFRARPPGMAS